jgi:hypothetical protein
MHSCDDSNDSADFSRFWCEVTVVVLLDTLMLVKDKMLHPCYFQKSTLFDLRRTAILTAVWGCE